MFKKILASLGINGSKVNFEIDNDVVELGGMVSGKVYISGGAADQKIEEITITLEVSSRYTAGDEIRHIHQEIVGVTVANKMMVEANSPAIVIPVQFKLPYNIPVSTYYTKYQFRTNLDIPNTIDSKDIDAIIIKPNSQVQCFLEALDLLGFRSKLESGSYNGRFQQFEYIPTKLLKGKLDELEVYFEVQPDRLNIVLQIDKKIKGLFAGIIDDLDLDERHVKFSLSNDQLRSREQTAEILKQIIEREYAKI